MAEIGQLHGAILSLCPTKQLPVVENIGKVSLIPVAVKMIPSTSTPTLSSTPPPQMITNRTMSVPTAAARKQGVGFPLNSFDSDDTGRILSTQRVSNDTLMQECGICKKRIDQHLLAKCDTCHLYYHLGCLNPPLTRHPKRSKQYAWQCSECDKSDDSAPENMIIPKGPRRSRIRYSKDGPIIPDPLRDSFGSEKSMSRKSEESHQYRTINGGDVETKVMEIPPPPPEQLPSESFVSEIVPATSTPEVTPKKRGRKPKAKITSESGDAKSPPPPPTIENHVMESLKPEQQQLTVGNVETTISNFS